jgi:regulatory protein
MITKKKEKAVKPAIEKAYDYLAKRAHTEYQLKLKLTKAGYPPEEIDTAVDELTDLGYIDDTDFAGRYLERLISKQYGRRRMFDEMRRQGIAPALAQEVIAEGYSEEAERENAWAVAQRAIESAAKDATQRDYARRISLKLTGKGYDYSVIHATIDRFFHSHSFQES